MIVYCLVLLYFYQDLKILITKGFWRDIKDALSLQDVVFTYIGSGMLFLYLLHQFNLNSKFYFMIVSFLILGTLLILVWNYQFYHRFDHCFSLVQMMIHLSSYFKEDGKIIRALERTHQYTRGVLKNQITNILASLQSYDDKESSFEILSHHYLIKSMVSMMVYHENHGDQYIVEGLNGLEDDLMVWESNLRQFKNNIRSFNRQIVMICLLTLVVGVMSQRMLAQTLDIHTSATYQYTVFIFMMIVLSVFLKSHKILSVDPVFEEEKL